MCIPAIEKHVQNSRRCSVSIHTPFAPITWPLRERIRTEEEAAKHMQVAFSLNYLDLDTEYNVAIYIEISCKYFILYNFFWSNFRGSKIVSEQISDTLHILQCQVLRQDCCIRKRN